MLSRIRSRYLDRKHSLRIAIIAAVVLGALAVSWQAGWVGLGSTAAHAGVSPMPATEVPSSLPAGGVQLAHGGIVLTPWASTPSGAMSEDQAIAAARVFNSASMPATALEADLTIPGSIPSSPMPAGSYTAIDRVPVWLVTFTSPTARNVSMGGGAPLYVTHRSVAVNAVSGAFVLGFFTP